MENRTHTVLKRLTNERRKTKHIQIRLNRVAEEEPTPMQPPNLGGLTEDEVTRLGICQRSLIG